MKKILVIIITSIFISPAVFSQNNLYQKIDLFGEVLENIKKNMLTKLINQK